MSEASAAFRLAVPPLWQGKVRLTSVRCVALRDLNFRKLLHGDRDGAATKLSKVN